MNLRPVELSSLERGSLRFRDPGDYERVLALLPGASAECSSCGYKPCMCDQQ